MIAEGVYHATTRKIAEAAGVNVATLHYHFHDKEEILFKVMEVLVANYRTTLAKQFAAPQNCTSVSRIFCGSSGARSKRLPASNSRCRK